MDSFVFAFCVQDAAGKLLFVKRSRNAAEYAGFWSIPTRRVPDSLFRQNDLGLPVLAPLLSRVVDLVAPKFLEAGQAERRRRAGYDLWMRLVHMEAAAVAALKEQKYSEFCWVPASQIASLFPRGGGMCVSMLVNHLIRSGRLSGAVPFVEIPPELAQAEADLPDNSEAWKAWGFEQYCQMSRTGGVDGGLRHKMVTVDRYFRRRAEELGGSIASAIDLGCGDGEFVRFLRGLGLEAVGVDLRLLPGALREPGFRELDLQREEIASGATYALITMNLLLPWISDLDGFLDRVARIARPGCRLLVSILAPDYAKNGDWVAIGEREGWLVTEPVRREPGLAMINHSVGPLVFYPRSILDYISAFARHGMYCERGSYLFGDSELSADERLAARGSRHFDRQCDFPSFAVMEFVVLPRPATAGGA